MNSLLARNLSKRSQTFVAKRFMSKSGAIPTGSTMEVNGTKVVGLNHMTVRYGACDLYPNCIDPPPVFVGTLN